MVPLYLVCLPDLVNLAHCVKTHSVSAGSTAFTLIVSAQISHLNNCLRTIEESSMNRHGNTLAAPSTEGNYPQKLGAGSISRALWVKSDFSASAGHATRTKKSRGLFKHREIFHWCELNFILRALGFISANKTQPPRPHKVKYVL